MMCGVMWEKMRHITCSYSAVRSALRRLLPHIIMSSAPGLQSLPGRLSLSTSLYSASPECPLPYPHAHTLPAAATPPPPPSPPSPPHYPTDAGQGAVLQAGRRGGGLCGTDSAPQGKAFHREGPVRAKPLPGPRPFHQSVPTQPMPPVYGFVLLKHPRKPMIMLVLLLLHEVVLLPAAAAAARGGGGGGGGVVLVLVLVPALSLLAHCWRLPPYPTLALLWPWRAGDPVLAPVCCGGPVVAFCALPASPSLPCLSSFPPASPPPPYPGLALLCVSPRGTRTLGSHAALTFRLRAPLRTAVREPPPPLGPPLLWAAAALTIRGPTATNPPPPAPARSGGALSPLGPRGVVPRPVPRVVPRHHQLRCVAVDRTGGGEGGGGMAGLRAPGGRRAVRVGRVALPDPGPRGCGGHVRRRRGRRGTNPPPLGRARPPVRLRGRGRRRTGGGLIHRDTVPPVTVRGRRGGGGSGSLRPRPPRNGGGA